MNIVDFLKQEMLVSFHTNDFIYDIQETFGNDNVIRFESENNIRTISVVYDKKRHTLTYKRTEYTGLPYYQLLSVDNKYYEDNFKI